MPLTKTIKPSALALEGPVAFGVGERRWGLASIAAAVAAALVVVSGESWRPDMITSFCIASVISLVLGLSPAIPRTLMFISSPSYRKINEVRKALAGLVICLGSLWLGFGLVGPAGALTVAAETAAFHCLLDGVLIKRGTVNVSSSVDARKSCSSNDSSGTTGVEGCGAADAVRPAQAESAPVCTAAAESTPVAPDAMVALRG